MAALAQRYGSAEPQEADVIVALGGDGLMLQSLHRTMPDRDQAVIIPRDLLMQIRGEVPDKSPDWRRTRAASPDWTTPAPASVARVTTSRAGRCP